MNRQADKRDDDTDFDPVFVHSRRESIVLLIGFGFFFLWSIGVSYVWGYGLSVDEASRSVLGVPHWVFWGVAVPWLGANVFTFWFCLFYMVDDPLGEALDEQQMADTFEDDAELRKDPS